MLASLTRKSAASMTRPSAGIRLPAERRMWSPGTIVLTGTVCSTPSRTTRQDQRKAFLQFLDGSGGPVLLKEAEQRTAEDDRQDDRRVHPLLQRQRDRGGDSQNENERAFELAQEKAQAAQAGRILNAVGTDKSKLSCGSNGRESGQALTREPSPKRTRPGSRSKRQCLSGPRVCSVLDHPEE